LEEVTFLLWLSFERRVLGESNDDVVVLRSLLLLCHYSLLAADLIFFVWSKDESIIQRRNTPISHIMMTRDEMKTAREKSFDRGARTPHFKRVSIVRSDRTFEEAIQRVIHR
jgi:hypothetical protein